MLSNISSATSKSQKAQKSYKLLLKAKTAIKILKNCKKVWNNVKLKKSRKSALYSAPKLKWRYKENCLKIPRYQKRKNLNWEL